MELKNKFENATDAFEYFNEVIRNTGVKFGDTKALFNVGFEIENPMDNHIVHRTRAWNHAYAQAEWLWYLSGDNSLKKLGEIYGKIPGIWKKMANQAGMVMSNYGWQWNRDYQLDIAINKLKKNSESRQASISIFDGKEFIKYNNDTPCTYAIHFVS
jgi:thymidylate synthase